MSATMFKTCRTVGELREMLIGIPDDVPVTSFDEWSHPRVTVEKISGHWVGVAITDGEED